MNCTDTISSTPRSTRRMAVLRAIALTVALSGPSAGQDTPADAAQDAPAPPILRATLGDRTAEACVDSGTMRQRMAALRDRLRLLGIEEREMREEIGEMQGAPFTWSGRGSQPIFDARKEARARLSQIYRQRRQVEESIRKIERLREQDEELLEDARARPVFEDPSPPSSSALRRARNQALRRAGWVGAGVEGGELLSAGIRGWYRSININEIEERMGSTAETRRALRAIRNALHAEYRLEQRNIDRLGEMANRHMELSDEARALRQQYEALRQQYDMHQEALGRPARTFAELGREMDTEGDAEEERRFAEAKEERRVVEEERRARQRLDISGSDPEEQHRAERRVRQLPSVRWRRSELTCDSQ